MTYEETMAILDAHTIEASSVLCEHYDNHPKAISWIIEFTGCSYEIAEKIVNEYYSDWVIPEPTITAVRCPYCKSTNVKKIGVVSRSMSVGMFGLGSSKIGKQWHCNGCKSDF